MPASKPETPQRPPKPVISKESRKRIIAFAKTVVKIQKEFGVEIGVQDDTIGFHDTRRTDEWICPDGQQYGYWDAQVFAEEYEAAVDPKRIQFEDFEAWDEDIEEPR